MKTTPLLPFPSPDWSPFRVLPEGERSAPPRPIDSPGGVGDRLRAAAFAEIQAREAFSWACNAFEDATLELKADWSVLVREENKHLQWLLNRMLELNIDIGEKGVSTQLWMSFQRCTTAREFTLFMANAEERGRRAGERFQRDLAQQDPESARIFGQIAFEEKSHIALAQRHFPGETLKP